MNESQSRSCTSSAAPALNILVVDDNLASLEAMAAALRQMGHTVDAVASGEDAIRHTSIFSPDVVLMDIRMPGVDGYEAARRIKTLVPQVVVVGMSGYVSDADSRQARAAGCDAQLVKPIQPAELGEFLTRLFVDEGTR